MKYRILYRVFGIALSVITVMTGSYGISSVNRESYELSLSLQEKADDSI